MSGVRKRELLATFKRLVLACQCILQMVRREGNVRLELMTHNLFLYSWPCLLGVIAGWSFANSIVGKLIAYYLLLPFGAICGIFSILAFFGDREKGREKNSSSDDLRMPVLIGILAISFVLGREGVSRFRTYEVRNFVEKTVPLLDAYKSKHGVFPPDLDEVTNRDLPYYFRNEKPSYQPYRSDGRGFTFYYETSESIMGGLMLSSSHRSWSVVD